MYIRTYILHYVYVLSRIGKTERETAAALCSISNRNKNLLNSSIEQFIDQYLKENVNNCSFCQPRWIVSVNLKETV